MLKSKKARQRVFKVARWLHVYLSTLLMVLLIFFCITGITLNHKWYDTKGNTDSMHSEPLTDALIEEWGLGADDWAPDLTRMSRDLSARYRLPEPGSIDLDAEMREVIFEYRVPAGFASIFVLAEDQLIEVEMERGSLLGILNDLHKGRHSGTVWFWLIDVSAVVMMLFAFAGLIILYQGKKYRRDGNIAMLVGLLIPVLIYFLCVPAVGRS